MDTTKQKPCWLVEPETEREQDLQLTAAAAVRWSFFRRSFFILLVLLVLLVHITQ